MPKVSMVQARAFSFCLQANSGVAKTNFTVHISIHYAMFRTLEFVHAEISPCLFLHFPWLTVRENSSCKRQRFVIGCYDAYEFT